MKYEIRNTKYETWKRGFTLTAKRQRAFTLITDFFGRKRSDIWVKSSKRGFTLIEVLIVITIIGILIGLSVVAFSAARKAGRDTKRKSDLYDIRSTLEIYRTDCGQYPQNSQFAFGATLVGSGACAGNSYNAIPTDMGTGGRIYRYNQSTSNTYELCASLELGSGTVTCGGSSDCGNGNTCNFKVTNP